MSESYLIYGGWGCYEAESASIEEWVNDDRRAAVRFGEIAEEYRTMAAAEVEKIKASEHLVWTSDEYSFVALLKFNGVSHSDGQIDAHGLARMSQLVEDAQFDLLPFVVEFEGQGWGEEGNYRLEKADVVRQIAEFYERR